MPVFNPGRCLPAALASIIGQTFTDFELLVIDDGSTDGSTRILESFARREPRLRLITRQNLGVIASRNQLLQIARGELIAWMDADDISLPDRLAKQVTVFSADPTLVCLGTAVRCIDPKGRDLCLEQYHTSHEEIVAAQHAAGGGIRFATTMMRRHVANAIGGFREPFKIGEDLDFLMRLGEAGRLANLRDVLYLYRQNVSSVCYTLGPYWRTYRDLILELARQRQSYGRDQLQAGIPLSIPAPPPGNRGLSRHLVYAQWSRQALANQDWLLAAKYSCAAVLNNPLQAQGWKTAARVAFSMASSLCGRYSPKGSGIR